ncbi:LLM class flavin-dependent oxidoreductase [Candidatus Litorirhabdus singularis]|uniref:LLM class flavin-dependent oxidoreductase n=1 Tax=Candidatus Litorirhabdus singularis TaxID=2518993 RepID=UPI00242B5B0D|nr:LLM class flavin-dependent oxidoreductase [Candidatus Litorirhabdus singularis]
MGLTPWHYNSEIDADALCRQAELAETWGYDSFFLPESHFSGATSLPDPMLLLAAVAARTTRLQLGTTSYLLPIRNALQAAQQVAALDRLCKGRLILGLGRGFQSAMLQAYGVDLKLKRQQFETVLGGMRNAWAGNAIDASAEPLRISPLPLQQPHPPLWVAAFGPKAITQVGSMGLPYLASPMETLDQLTHNHQLHRDAISKAGKKQPPEIIIMRTVYISEDPDQCAQVRDKLASVGAGVHAKNAPNPVDDWCLIGSPEQVGVGIERYQRHLGMTHLIAVRPRVPGISRDANCESMRLLSLMRKDG